jgi:2-C-methyl-D-erythritol 4-phosphate cytidylyltransferase
VSDEHAIDEVIAVVLAAGSGERLGTTRPKAFVGLGDKVLLAWSLEAFDAHDAIDSIVLVVPSEWEEPAQMLVEDLGCDCVSSIEVGGTTRAASVVAALSAIPDSANTAVLVHDAARPIVPAAIVERVLEPLQCGYDAAVPTLPVVDTVKKVEAGGDVIATVDRDELRRAQTPQAVRASMLHTAYSSLDEAGLAATTDCSQAVAAVGGKVCVVDGDERLLKVTTDSDLKLLQSQVESGSYDG